MLINGTGYGPNQGTASGARLDLLLDKNSALELEYVSGGTLARIEVLSTVVSSTGIHLKQFLGNSFYLRLGGDFRKIEYKYVYLVKPDSSAGPLRPILPMARPVQCIRLKVIKLIF